jgi:hypothetical protein
MEVQGWESDAMFRRYAITGQIAEFAEARSLKLKPAQDAMSE